MWIGVTLYNPGIELHDNGDPEGGLVYFRDCKSGHTIAGLTLSEAQALGMELLDYVHRKEVQTP